MGAGISPFSASALDPDPAPAMSPRRQCGIMAKSRKSANPRLTWTDGEITILGSNMPKYSKTLMTLWKYVTAQIVYYRTRRAISSQFDIVYYGKINTDLLEESDLLAHYIRKGWREGRNPAPWFSSNGYLDANPDVREAGLNPFLHYVVHGRAEERPCPPASGAGLHPMRLPRVSNDSLSTRVDPHDSLAAARFERIQVALERSGFFSEQLVQKFKVCDYRTLMSEPPKDDAACYEHFAEKGHAYLFPIAFGLEFDPDFYASYELKEFPSDVAAYRHWLTDGLPANRPCNARQLLKSLNIDGSDFPKNFDAACYLANNNDLSSLSQSNWRLLEHFIKTGIRERRSGCPLLEETASIYLAAADLLAVSDHAREAQRVYEAVLRVAPSNSRALNHIGDNSLRGGDYGYAISHYKLLIENKFNIFAFWNLAAAERQLGNFDGAIQALEQGIDKYPSDSGLRKFRLDVLRDRFENDARYAQAYAIGLRRDAAKRFMKKAATELAVSLEERDRAPLIRGPIKNVAIVGDHELEQCRLYRIEQKIEQFHAIGMSVTSFASPHELTTASSELFKFDAVIFYRVPGWLEVLRLIESARQLGLPTFYEIDDLIFDADYYPDSFATYGDLITREEYAGLMTGAEAFKSAMAACDYAIASTEPLARHMAAIVKSGKSFVHRNGLGKAHERAIRDVPARKRCRDEIVLFYGSGTKAHKSDFEDLVAPALSKLFKRHSSLRLQLVGFQSLPKSLSKFASRIECTPPIWDISKYWELLGRSDINLAVLSRNEATECKSEIKWMEAAMLGIPSVVSRTRNYEDVIDQGKTGIMVDTPEEWFEALDKLIESREVRCKIGEAAKSAVSDAYHERHIADNLDCIMHDSVPLTKSAEKKRWRIVIVNVFYPPQAIGGATRVVHDNVRDLRARHGNEFDIEVYSSFDGGLEPYQIFNYANDGIRVSAVSTPSEPDIDKRPLDEEMGRLFEEFLRARQPDLVHFHCIQRLTSSLLDAAKAMRVPFLVTVHDGWWISDRQFLVNDLGEAEIYSTDDRVNMEKFGEASASRAQTLRRSLSAAERILAVSDRFADVYRAAGFDNVVSIPNGVSKFMTPIRASSKDGRVRLGYLGGMEPHKGYPLLRAAVQFGDFQNLSLTVVDHSAGVGVERREVWGTTPVLFVGRCPQDKVHELYGNLDVLLAPSVWPESFGLVTREALACGLWVVASDRGAVGEGVKEGENGFIVHVDTPKYLADALRKIDRDPGHYVSAPRISSPLRSAAEQADDLADFYRQILNSRKTVCPLCG